MTAIDYQKLKSIAVVRRDGLGDLLCIYPLILLLKKKAPHAKITLFVDERNVALIPFLPDLGDIAVFPKRGNKYWNALKMASSHFGKFDLAISAKTSPMKLMNFFLFLLKAKKRIAYVDKSWHNKFINHPVPYQKIAAKNKHQALKGLELIGEKLSDDLLPQLKIPASMSEKFGALKKKLKEFKKDLPLFLINVSINRDSSRIEESKYAEILNDLHAHQPISVIVTGEKKDQERAQKITSLLKMPYLLQLTSSFEEFMVVLDSSSHVFIGDGGVGHLAAAFNKKGVVLYGDTSLLEWAPLSKELITLHNPQDVNLINNEQINNSLLKTL